MSLKGGPRYGRRDIVNHLKWIVAYARATGHMIGEGENTFENDSQYRKALDAWVERQVNISKGGG